MCVKAGEWTQLVNQLSALLYRLLEIGVASSGAYSIYQKSQPLAFFSFTGPPLIAAWQTAYCIWVLSYDCPCFFHTELQIWCFDLVTHPADNQSKGKLSQATHQLGVLTLTLGGPHIIMTHQYSLGSSSRYSMWQGASSSRRGSTRLSKSWSTASEIFLEQAKLSSPATQHVNDTSFSHGVTLINHHWPQDRNLGTTYHL